MKLRILSLIVLLFPLFCPAQDAVKQKIRELQNSSSMKGAGFGMLVVDPATNGVLVDVNSTTSFVPASLVKIVTSAAALEILGGSYTFKTKLAMTGTFDKTTGELKGDIAIIGGGDPTLGSDYFTDEQNPNFVWLMVNAVKSEGIKKISGNILMDNSIYDDNIVPDNWTWGDIGNYYGTGATGIMVHDNSVKIFFRSGEAPGSPAVLTHFYPAPDSFKIENYVLVSDDQNDKTVVYGPTWGDKREIRGTIPKKRDGFEIKASMPEPEKVAGYEFKDWLGYEGIIVPGTIKTGKVGSGATVIFENTSPILSEIVGVLNHKSVNLFAECLVKQIAFEKTGIGSTVAGLKIISDFWAGKGIDTGGLFLDDGSGLSRSDAISPQQVAGILKYMKTRSREWASFINSLPEAGEGTLSVFDPKKFPDHSLICKSGSMTRVRAFAGYLKTISGKDLVFVMMANNFSMNQKDIIAKMEDILLTMREKL